MGIHNRVSNVSLWYSKIYKASNALTRQFCSQLAKPGAAQEKT